MYLKGTIYTEVNVGELNVLEAAAQLLSHGYHDTGDTFLKVLKPGEEGIKRRWLVRYERTSNHRKETRKPIYFTCDEEVIDDVILSRKIEKVFERELKRKPQLWGRQS